MRPWRNDFRPTDGDVFADRSEEEAWREYRGPCDPCDVEVWEVLRLTDRARVLSIESASAPAQFMGRMRVI